jgi:hypothetical protein
MARLETCSNKNIKKSSNKKRGLKKDIKKDKIPDEQKK